MPSFGKLVDKEVIRKELARWDEQFKEAEREFVYFMNERKPFNIPPSKFFGITYNRFPQFDNYDDFMKRFKEEEENPNRSFNNWFRLSARFDYIKSLHPDKYYKEIKEKLDNFSFFLSDSVVEVYVSDEDWYILNGVLNLREYTNILTIAFLYTK